MKKEFEKRLYSSLIIIPISLFLNKKIFTFIALLFCFFIFSLSFYKFKTNELKLTGNQVRLVQPNFSHSEKWDKNKFNENMNELMRLSKKNIQPLIGFKSNYSQ